MGRVAGPQRDETFQWDYKLNLCVHACVRARLIMNAWRANQRTMRTNENLVVSGDFATRTLRCEEVGTCAHSDQNPPESL